jgi:GxxExxY protein
VLVELKAIKEFDEVHLAQCLNYLKATGLQLCLLINFGTPRIRIKRVISPFYPCLSGSICGSK